MRNFLCLLALPLSAFAYDYTIDTAHSAAQFSVRHMMVSNVKGEFTKLTGTLAYDPAHPTAGKVEATIDVTTISTREPKRDEHLKSPDFFDAAKYPSITFKSKSIAQESGKLLVKGDLTLHGVTKEVILTTEISPEIKDRAGYRMGASATTKINRKDFGLAWNRAIEAGGVAVGDEVTITIDLEATRK